MHITSVTDILLCNSHLTGNVSSTAIMTHISGWVCGVGWPPMGGTRCSSSDKKAQTCSSVLGDLNAALRFAIALVLLASRRA